MAAESTELTESKCLNSLELDVTEEIQKSPTLRCQYYLSQKKRMCRMLPIPGTQFCGLHLALTDGDIHVDYKRVPCPYDPNHSVYPAKLEKHLFKCNARPKPRPVYHVEGINSGLTGFLPSSEETYSLAEFPEEYIRSLIARVETVYNEFVKSIRHCYITHLSMKDELTDANNGVTARKHLIQQASLIGLIHQTLTNHKDVTFIEFGAGRGKLSHWVQRSLPESAVNSEFIVIDRAACRYKFDSYHKSAGPVFSRLFIDIEHLCISKVANIAKERSIVGYCKHLCGGATDLAISCLMNTLMESKRPSVLAMAPCCHHKCTWPAYVGRKFFETQLKFSSIDFHAISLLTSWRTCGMKHSEDVKGDPSLLSIRDWPAAYKEEVGYKCKRLIDMGRVSWLRDNGMKTEMLAYVPQDVTVENVVIVATSAES